MSAQAKLNRSRIAGLVLAAGRSARMGASQNKLTMNVEGKPLVAWPVEAMRGAGIEQPLIVTGFDAASVASALSESACEFAHHAEWEAGMGASLAFGVRRLLEAEASTSGGFEALLLCLGDLPGIRSALVERLLGAVGAQPLGNQIFVPTHAGRSGHPVLFGRRFWPQLASLDGDMGAKRVIAGAQERVVEIDLGSEAIFNDIDTAADLARWQAARE